MSGIGTCGGVTGAVLPISYVVGVTSEELAQRKGNMQVAPCVPAVEYVINRFEEEYGAIDCLRMRYNRVQRAFDFLDPDGSIWEMTFHLLQCTKCAMAAPTFEKGRDETPPVKGAMWAAEAICDLLRMEPEERKKPPAHLRELEPQEVEKVQKVVQYMKELNYGHPDEKITYRDYRKLKLKGKKRFEEERPGAIKAPRDFPTSGEK